jgi:hypothetical protein
LWGRITVSLTRYANPAVAAKTFVCDSGKTLTGIGDRACLVDHKPPKEGVGASVSIEAQRKYDDVRVDYYSFPGDGHTVDDAAHLATAQEITRQLLA